MYLYFSVGDNDKHSDSARQKKSTEEGLLVDKAVKEDQIQLTVEVLTSKACSEEGLEDVTALMSNLSCGGTETRESILNLLLAFAWKLTLNKSSRVLGFCHSYFIAGFSKLIL